MARDRPGGAAEATGQRTRRDRADPLLAGQLLGDLEDALGRVFRAGWHLGTLSNDCQITTVG